MPTVKYFGRPTQQQGKYLWDLLGNLKNFGVGRIFVRQMEVAEHPGEMSFYKVVSVKPAMDEKHVKEEVLCERVFRGVKMERGRPVVVNPKIQDWQLVPKSMEKLYVDFKAVDPTIKKLPSLLNVPPLMKEILAGNKGNADTVKVPYKYDEELKNAVVASEGEKPDVTFDDSAPRLHTTSRALYENLEEFEKVLAEIPEDTKEEMIMGRKLFREFLDKVEGHATHEIPKK
ncbi:unnamed protein product [Notodromas monacha]|uniref:Uncharacterized protein n=1 Tax=Notodromas monacha TaxID=399045 RepID=A0A7R9GI53_9CRUS|nr:unnamed protein product [Notodromas monacha]CAG0921439.1 unnamed protein product [Notodromas monacha]